MTPINRVFEIWEIIRELIVSTFMNSILAVLLYEIFLGKRHIKKLFIEEETRINKFTLSHDQSSSPT